MRSEFNEWYAKWTGTKVKCENTDIIGAWQHQQSKVDELTKQTIDQGQRFNEQSQRVKDLEHKNGELQKQVDDCINQAKEFIQSCKVDADIFEDKYQAKVAYGAEAVVELLEQALKGEGCQ